MNKRIKQLAEQANELDYETFDEYNHKTVQHYKFDKEKFAQLIVKECVGICECEWNGDADTFAASEAYNECADAIKEYFGVEE